MPDDAPQPPPPDHIHRHDLQNHVTVIRGQAQLLKRKLGKIPELPDQAREAIQTGLDKIDETGQTLSASIARGTGKDSPKPEPYSGGSCPREGEFSSFPTPE